MFYLRDKENVIYVHREIYYKHLRYMPPKDNRAFLIPLSGIW